MSLRRLKLSGMILPVVFLVVLDLVRHRLWAHYLHTWTGIALTTASVAGLAVAFTHALFRRIEALTAANSRLHDEAREALAFLQNLIDYSADGVIVVGVDGRIRIWNHGAESIYGFRREETLGALPPMVPPERAHEVDELMARALRGESVRNFETQRLRKDGRLIDVVVTVTPVRDARGQIVAVLGISKDVTQLKQMERQLQQLAVLEERERIGMDLHDSVIQSIYAVALQLEDCAAQVEAAPQAVRLRLDTAIEALHAITRDIRSYILGLRPGLRQDGDLVAGLADLLRSFEANSLVHGELHGPGCVDGLEPGQVVHLLQLTREALANVQRHARATAVSVTVTQEGGLVRLTIRDNGVGFDPGEPQGPHQLGLRNMIARARAAGGQVQFHSAPGAGTTVEVTVPVRNVTGTPAEGHVDPGTGAGAPATQGAEV